MLARLYPFAPRQGFVLKSYTLTNEGLRFVGARGWYEITDELAEKLREIPQQSRSPEGPRAFAIAKNVTEAEKIDARIDEILRRGAGEDDRIGTAASPVPLKGTPAKRPGTRTRATVAVSEDPDPDGDEDPDDSDDEAGEAEAKPKTRKRRS